MSIVYFLVLIGVLVTIHEFGHFVAAKLLDFQVTTFSIGFGRPLLRARIGDTEYRLGLVPLGGFVRILGEDPEEPGASPRSFTRKPLWQRLVVVFAGPLANLVLPVAIYFVFFAGHSELPASVIGDILPGGPAAEAGLEPGDRITSIDGGRSDYFEDLETAVQSGPGEEIKLHVERGGREFDKYIVPVAVTTRHRDGRSQTHGSIGVTWAPFVPRIAVVDSSSPAARAGLRTGDMVVSIDGDTTHNWGEVRRAFEARGRRRNVAYFRPTATAGGTELWTPGLAAMVPDSRAQGRKAPVSYTGMAPADMYVTRVDPGSPADLAGLRRGDLITSLDGSPMEHWLVLDQRLQSRPDHTWTLGWQRPSSTGEVLELSAPVRQVFHSSTDEYGNKRSVLLFGAHSRKQAGRSAMAPIDGRVSYAVSRAVDRTGETVTTLASGLWAIVRGQAPEAMGGPVTMYRAASVSGQRGWSEFLLLIALISVSVGLLNLLPIPGLDGGQVLVFAIEAVSRGPLSARARDRLTTAGLGVVGLITVLAIKNDVMRILWP